MPSRMSVLVQKCLLNAHPVPRSMLGLRDLQGTRSLPLFREPGARRSLALTQSPKSTVSLSQTHGDPSLAASALSLLSMGLVISQFTATHT